MLKNYITIAYRNLLKNRVFSLINLIGLAVGISFSLLIGGYVWGELQVNRGLRNADRQYIILSKWKNPNMGIEIFSVAQLSRALKQNYPGLVADDYNSNIAFTNVSYKNKHFREGLQVGDSTLLSIYGFKLLHGSKKTALHDPFSVVITKEAAEKYFGRTDVLNENLNFEDFSGHSHDFAITGVLDELPRNTITEHGAYKNVNFFFNASTENFFQRNLEGWDNTKTACHIELQPKADPREVETAIKTLLKKNTSSELYRNLTPRLVPLKEYNLIAHGGLINKMTWTLSCIALFILLMAVINFVNISIGRSSGRMKEMGMRKVMGSLKRQLIWQFLIESVLLTIVSTALAMIFYFLARPYFNTILDRDIPDIFEFPIYFILIPIFFAIIIGLLAGIYPALILSALKSIDSIKGKTGSIREGILFRKILVGTQFTIASVTFIGAIVISSQINLFFKSDLGYKKEYVIYAQVPRDWSAKGVHRMEAIRDLFIHSNVVEGASLSWEVPIGLDEKNEYPVYRQDAGPSNSVLSHTSGADNAFAAVYTIPMRAGRFFKPTYEEGDSSQTVINEKELKALGWVNPQDALGRKLISEGRLYTICGVTSDFHFGSMQDEIEPMIYTNINYDTDYRYFSFKVKGGNMQTNLTALQKKWSELLPGAPFEYNFLDDGLTRLYSAELQMKRAAYIASALAILIVLIGVLGLISLSVQKRSKEIGIRKVLGSTVAGISGLFLKDFLTVVVIAGCIACPLAYFLLQQWLNNYAYKIKLSIIPFIGVVATLTLLTGLLIVLQTIKAALTNPVKGLRNE